jgi:RNA exonuclease 1
MKFENKPRFLAGITKEMMLKATKTRQEVQEEIRSLLPADAILVGHSLNFDLHALKMIHPYCVDTSIIFNNTGEHTRKTKLKVFSALHLQETIQDSDMGHSSIEDSLASLKLTQLKLANDIYFGDVVLQNKKNFHQRQLHTNIADPTTSDGVDRVQTTIFNQMSKRSKKSSIVTAAKNNVDYEQYFKAAHEAATENGNADIPIGQINHSQMKDAKTVIKTASELALEHDFNMAHVEFEELNEENAERLIKRADKFIGRLWKSVALNGLFVVVLAGGKGEPRGITMVQIKTEKNCLVGQQECDDDE